MVVKTLPEIVNDVYVLLEPLDSDNRQKVVGSVMALLGDNPQAFTKKPSVGGYDGGGSSYGDKSLGLKAQRWMQQNHISPELLEEIFHCENGEVEFIACEVPGSGKKGQSKNCYLLAGVRSLLANDEAKFTDAEAVLLCKHVGCYDAKNHAATRSDLGNTVAGTKNSGFTLPAPGLRAAAEVIKQMSP